MFRSYEIAIIIGLLISMVICLIGMITNSIAMALIGMLVAIPSFLTPLIFLVINSVEKESEKKGLR